MKLKFIVDGKAQAKQSFKVGVVHGFAKKYTPTEFTEYSNWVKISFKMMHPTHDWKTFIDKQLAVKITVNSEVPKSYSKKKAAMCLAGEIRPTSKPDCDNIAKNILDAMTGVVYPDDKQVVSLLVQKQFAERSFVEITVIGM